MTSLTGVDAILMDGNTYANIPLMRRIGAKFQNAEKGWWVDIATHPLNNSKQRLKLLAMLTEAEENGVRLHIFKAEKKPK